MPGLSALLYKDSIDPCRPHPRLLQSHGALWLQESWALPHPWGGAGLSSKVCAVCPQHEVPMTLAWVKLSILWVEKVAKLPWVTFPLSSDAFDNELIVKTLKEITEGKTVQIPVYDFVSHSRSNSRSCLAVPLLTPCGAAHSPALPRLLPSVWVPNLLAQSFHPNSSSPWVRASQADTGTG